MPDVSWRQFKDHSGCLVRGTIPIAEPSDKTNHLSCTAWLTAQVEAPFFGTVQGYDGCGLSAGLLHNILVSPDGLSQGSLGGLVRRLMDTLGPTNASVVAMQGELAARSWMLAGNGTFRTGGGIPLAAASIRNWVAPQNGVVPKAGPDWELAKKAALIFHNLFSEPAGFVVQERYAIEWLAAGNRTAELAAYQRFVPGLVSPIGLRVASMPPELHIAMAVYHSFSVNNPKIAGQALGACGLQTTSLGFAKKLIGELGLHGRDVWRDLPGDGDDRYDRTRKAVWARPDLFPGGPSVLPKDLPK